MRASKTCDGITWYFLKILGLLISIAILTASSKFYVKEFSQGFTSYAYKMDLWKKLRIEYLEAIPPVRCENLKFALKTDVAAIFRNTVGNEQNNLVPPIQYRISYVKYMIKYLENLSSSYSAYEDDTSSEIVEDLLVYWYTSLEKLSKTQSLSEPFYRYYNISGPNPNEDIFIKIFENEGGTFVSEGTTGLVTWEASIEFVKWFGTQNFQSVAPAPFNWAIELGSGCGFLGISVLKLLPNNVKKFIASDGSPQAMVKCEQNFKANFSSRPAGVQFETLDWTTDMDKFDGIVRDCTKQYGLGYLFGADIVFDPELIPSLVALIGKFLQVQNGQGKAILSCTVRNEATVSNLQSKLDNYRVKTVNSWENGFIVQIE